MIWERIYNITDSVSISTYKSFRRHRHKSKDALVMRRKYMYTNSYMDCLIQSYRIKCRVNRCVYVIHIYQ